MITTSESITIKKVLRLGVITAYTVDNVSLFIKANGTQKRYNATSMVNATATSTGLVTFENVLLPEDGGYSFYITAESVTDLDTDGISLNRLATGYVKKITNATEVIV